MTIEQVKRSIRKHRKGPWEFVLNSGQGVRVLHVEDLAFVFDDKTLVLYSGGYEYRTQAADVTAIRVTRQKPPPP